MKNKQCRTHRYSQGGHALQILEYLVILCFEKRRPKQKCCCLPEVKHFPPKVFGLATPLAGPPMTMMTKKNWWSSTWYNCHYCISSASQDLEQQKDVNFLSFSYFLVGASLDVFSVLFHYLYEILIAALRARCSKPIWSKFQHHVQYSYLSY